MLEIDMLSNGGRLQGSKSHILSTYPVAIGNFFKSVPCTEALQVHWKDIQKAACVGGGW